MPLHFVNRTAIDLKKFIIWKISFLVPAKLVIISLLSNTGIW